MKKLLLPALVLLSVIYSFSGCSSAQVYVPGEPKILIRNITVEYSTIGDGYFDLKNYNKAIDYYRKAMRNKDIYLATYYKLARAYALGKEYTKAIEAYSFLLSKDPDNITLKESLAYVYAVKGDNDAAIKQYKVLISDNPYNESLLQNYTSLLINIGRGEAAEEYYFLLKEKFPDNTELTNFTQKLSEIVDNFSPDKKEKASDVSDEETAEAPQKK